MVFTSDLAERNIDKPYILFSTYIRPALVSKDPLPENNEAFEAFKQQVLSF